MPASAVVHSEGHGRDVNTLLRRADIAMYVAMYVAKARSVGTFTEDPATDGHFPAKVARLADLRRALERDELVLHDQPEVQISTDEVVGRQRSTAAGVGRPLGGQPCR